MGCVEDGASTSPPGKDSSAGMHVDSTSILPAPGRLPLRRPDRVFANPKSCGSCTQLPNGEWQVKINQVATRMTRQEMERAANHLKNGSLNAFDFCGKESALVLRYLVGGCGISPEPPNGIIYLRNPEIAAQSHFNAHHKNWGAYNFITEGGRGLLDGIYPGVGGARPPRQTFKCDRNFGSGRFGRQPLVPRLTDPEGKGNGKPGVAKEIRQEVWAQM